MKFLISLGYIVVTSFIVTTIKMNGISLGFIPSFIIYSVMFALIGVSCNAYEKTEHYRRHEEKQKEKRAIYNATIDMTKSEKKQYIEEYKAAHSKKDK